MEFKENPVDFKITSDSFFEKLDKITRSEIARKYLCMAQKVIDKKTQKNELTNIAEELLRMDDTIDSYIKF